MSLAIPEIISGASASGALFGGNILANHGDFSDAAYDDVIEDLGVTTLRFPGGSLTEYLFDVRNPDATMSFDSRSGEMVEMIPLTDFMTFAQDSGHAATIVVPTQTQLSTATDANGDRLPQIDEEGLRSFVQDVANGVYGDVEIRAFEVGNEYWGSGEMNAAEYGRLAAEMSVIIDDALSQIGEEDIDVVVQKGYNFDQSRLSEDYVGVSNADTLSDLNATYDLDLGEEAVFQNGSLNWTYINNDIILSNFDTQEEQDAIDGVVAHVYSYGADNPNSRSFNLNNINNTWREEMPDLDIYVTEWNLRSTASLNAETEYGLFQAHEMLNLMEEFVLSDVTEANVWPLIQNTRNTLSPGRDHEEASVGGEMFAMMSHTLPGKTLLDFKPEDGRTTEQMDGDVAVHAFAGGGELALYVVNTHRDDATMTDIDISGLVSGIGAAEIIQLGVAPGQSSGSSRSDATVETLDADEVMQDGFIVADLLPGEILQIVLSDITVTEAFQPAWAEANVLPELVDYRPPDDSVDVLPPLEGEEDMPVIPAVPLQQFLDQSESSEDEEDPGVEDDSSMDFGLAFLPLLLLLGLAGM